jgi:hypothetical protein
MMVMVDVGKPTGEFGKNGLQNEPTVAHATRMCVSY